MRIIEEVHKAFPKLPIYVATDATKEELDKHEPNLRKIAERILPLGVQNIQDAFEFSWDTEKEKNNVYLFLHETFQKVFSSFEKWPSYNPAKIPIPKGKVYGDNAKGGNFEVLPDGTPIVGDTLPKEVLEYFQRLIPKKTIEVVDTNWLEVGHVDEIFLWTIDPKKKEKCLLFYTDPSITDLVNEKNFEEMENLYWKIRLP